MDQMRQSSRNSWLYISAAGAIVVLAIASACSIRTDTSEIDSYQLAVKTQTKADALRFIEAFRTSHLVGDLIESLPPDVALQVCAELSGRAERSCEQLREIAAIAPASSIPPQAPAPASPQTSPITAKPMPVPPFKPNQTAATPPETTQATPANPPSETASQVVSTQTKVGSAIEAAEETESTTTTPEPPMNLEAEAAPGSLGKSIVDEAQADGDSAESWMLRTGAKDGGSATTKDSAQAAARAAAKAKAAAEAKARAEAEAKAKARAARARAAKAAMERRNEKDGSSSGGSKKGSGRDSKN
jgi:colicin import membrane protein